MEKEDLLTYCGRYGGSCARYRGYTAFRAAAALLAEICDAHGFRYWMPKEVKEFNYDEFRKGLEFFSKEDTWLVCPACCKGGGGGPPDCVRDCCQRHGVDVCFECPEFPCDRVKGDKDMLKRAGEYRRLGREGWLRRAAEKAERGFEFHTGKCYRVCVEDGKLKSSCD
ncbi:hypothetical protein DRO56_01900 [Candidatus Bathyarchaeota archaeon]|nr:DUF3795 domain-containing protein [Candidatus Bathyarchaeota archaeon]RLI33349.1 MAG: hypothetical protein DRO56_01900 [Candidatus Bathyarchaeota archaeon]